MTDTEGIIDTARYLREVRPIDPEEIFEYVEGRPHPAVVRQTLREHAFDLGLRERDDGTFVPVAEGPVEPWARRGPADTDHTDDTDDTDDTDHTGGVEAFPDAHARRLEDLLVDRFGPGWPDGETGDRLRDRIDRLKTEYFAGEHVEYDEETALAYALYHVPDYYAAIQYLLDDLAADGLLGRRLRVLDVGAGTGGPALGIHDYLPEGSVVDYHAVEPSAAAAVLEHLLEGTRPSFHVTIHRERAEEFSPEGTFDLAVFANVVSELQDPAAVLDRYLDALADDGTLIALSPAEERTATRLREVERTLVDRRDGVTVYAPTIRLWPDLEPADRGWTFRRERDLEVPGFQRRLDEGSSGGEGDGEPGGPAPGRGTYVNVDVQFAYLLVRLDGRRAIEYTPDPSRVARMDEMDRHVTERIDLVALKLSPDLADGGNPLFKVSDGSEHIDHYAVLTRESALNEVLVDAPYGALLRFENVLVLWNDDEDAYNLVVDDETVVDRLA